MWWEVGGWLISPLQSLVHGTEHRSTLSAALLCAPVCQGPCACLLVISSPLQEASLSPFCRHRNGGLKSLQACPRPHSYALANVKTPTVCQVLRRQRWAKQGGPIPCEPYSLEGTRKR